MRPAVDPGAALRQNPGRAATLKIYEPSPAGRGAFPLGANVVACLAVLVLAVMPRLDGAPRSIPLCQHQGGKQAIGKRRELVIDTLPVSVCSAEPPCLVLILLQRLRHSRNVFGPALCSLLSHHTFLYLLSHLLALIRGWEIGAEEAARVLSVSAPLKVKHSVMWF